MGYKLSSDATIFFKFVLPVLWTCLLVLIVDNQVPTQTILIAVVFGVWFFGRYCVPLKRVSIDGQDLVISNYFRSIAVPLTQIENVTESFLMNTHPVWIHFQEPTDFGSKIVFMPKMRLFPGLFSSHPVVTELKCFAELDRRK